MEAISDQSARPGNSALAMGLSKLRYPLRSAARAKDEKPAITEPTVSSASKRGRSSPAASKSVSVLDLSGKDKSAKPSRRLSIPTKPAASPRPVLVGSITPTSDTRAKRSNIQGKNDTPLSEISKSICRQKFNVLSSVSYWLTQIKLSESASRHSISLGFFKLALESGCEPLDRLCEELKWYIQRHNLVAEQEESVKELLQRYNIIEDLERLKLSETCSKLPEEVAQKSDKDRYNISSTARPGNMTPKSLNLNGLAVVANSNKKDGIQKRQPTFTNRGLYNKNAANCAPIKDNDSTNTRRKSQKPRTEPVNGNEKIRKSLNNCPFKKPGDKADVLPTEEASHEDKENMDVHVIEEANAVVEIQVN